jgi:hypothetical protein
VQAVHGTLAQFRLEAALRTQNPAGGRGSLNPGSRAPRVAAVGRAGKLAPVFGEEEIAGNERHQAGGSSSLSWGV